LINATSCRYNAYHFEKTSVLTSFWFKGLIFFLRLATRIVAKAKRVAANTAEVNAGMMGEFL